MLKAKAKKKNELKNRTIFLLITIIVLLFISNIYFICSYLNIDKDNITTEEVLFTKVEGSFDSKKKYYATIKYKKFKTLYKSNKVSTIAVIDNSSNTHDKFIEMINKTSFYKHTKIYLLEVSKLSKKDEVSFYELDERLSALETNYIITISNNKILSITTFDNEQLNKIVEGIGE